MGGFGSQGPADAGPATTEGPAVQPPPALPVQRLQRKLKEAARKILHLCLEKEQLLELGNRLRAELSRHAGEPAQGLARDAVAPGSGGGRRPGAGWGRREGAQRRPCAGKRGQASAQHGLVWDQSS